MNQKPDVNALLEQIKSPDAAIRSKAQQSAGPSGAVAIAPLAVIATASDPHAAKAAYGAIEAITHHAARPEARQEANAVSAALLGVAQANLPYRVRDNALHLLGYVASDTATIKGIAAFLQNKELREEARMALERIPGSAATNALSKAAKEAPAEFRPTLEQSLRNRATSLRSVGIGTK